jgi:hypothetical protein
MAFCVRRFNSTGDFIGYSAAFQQRREATAGRKSGGALESV